MTNKLEYTVVKDENGWGVEWHGALVNDEPMTYHEAKELAYECNNYPNNWPYADENPLWE